MDVIVQITQYIRDNWYEVYFGHIDFAAWDILQHDRVDWCVDNLEMGEWIWPGGRKEFFFKNKDDALMFKLTWWDKW
jgi:hypothetical protein